MVAVRLAERQWTHDRTGWADRFEVDKTNIAVEWGRVDGPWHHEPDKVQWMDLMTGYPCLAHRGNLGAWCGYVGVPPGHRYHGVHHSEANETLHAYGGVNYSAPCDDGWPDESYGVCHVPEPGQSENVWWLGFACARMGDLQPFAPVFWQHESPLRYTYRTLAFVQVWCHILAHQLAPKLLTA